MKNKIIWKFLGAYIFLILIAVLVLNFFVSLKLRDYYEFKISDKLISNSFLVGDILTQDLSNNRQESIQQKTEYFAEKLNLRVTVIDKKGTVLGDSQIDPNLMESHIDRPEILEAIEDGVGESNRFSDTLGYNMKYVAVSVKQNNSPIGIIRLALPLTEVESQMRIIYRVVLFGGVISIFIALIVGYFISRSITSPISEMKDIASRIAKGDFSRKAKIKSRDELGALARSLNQMADELQLKIENLKKLDKVRTDFVANVSHELKTPLTSIKGFIETLEDGAIEDKANARRFIAIIKKHTERLSNIINDLLSLSELELGRDRIQRDKFDLKALMNEVILGFGHALSVKKHKLTLDPQGSDFVVVADKAKIEQVIVNLVDNAVKYTKECGTIEVSLSQEGGNSVITIKDNGIGIPKEHLNRIFERFYRVDKARSRQLGGTGLGLALVKHIVSLHNGSVDIESQVKKGTTVRVSIPKSI